MKNVPDRRSNGWSVDGWSGNRLYLHGYLSAIPRTPSRGIAERGSAVESGTGLVNVSNESDVSPLMQNEKGSCTDESPHPAESPRHAGRRLRS
eukprot:4393591-Pyramimonas_sp.AAC.1